MLEQGFDFEDPDNAIETRFFENTLESKGEHIGEFTDNFVSAMPKNHPTSDEWV